ncbi:hypothetical protein FDECE_4304 [Fusarium decemcellulare]|nr:hypothetical protein FDECE_4304 [Fusarium decemcellulare]
MSPQQTDDFNVPLGSDIYFISRRDQQEAIKLEGQGLCRPLQISTTTATSIYLVVWHEHHEAPARLMLSPFTIPQFAHQIFYGASLWYTRCCATGPRRDAITKTVRRVYNIYFPLGKCHFDDNNQKEMPIAAAITELSCHERAQLGLDLLLNPSHSAHSKRAHGFSHGQTSYLGSILAEVPRRSPKRPRLDNHDVDSAYWSDTLPDASRPASHRQDNPEQYNPASTRSQQDHPQQDHQEKGNTTPEEDAQSLVKKALKGLKELHVKNLDVEFLALLPVQLTNRTIEVKVYETMQGAQNSTTIWELGDRLAEKAQSSAWLMFLISASLRVVETKMGRNAPNLDDHEERRRLRWTNGILILNKIVNSVGVVGFRLYDAYGKKNFRFSNSACKPPDDRDLIVQLATNAILEKRISAPAHLHILYIPYVIWTIFDCAYEENLSQADVCKILGLENFADFQIHSPFVPLEQLYSEQQRLQPNKNTIGAPHGDQATSQTPRRPTVEGARSLPAVATETTLGDSSRGATTPEAAPTFSIPKQSRGSSDDFRKNPKSATTQEPKRAGVTSPLTTLDSTGLKSHPASNTNQPPSDELEQGSTSTTPSLPRTVSASDSTAAQRHPTEDPAFDTRSESQANTRMQESPASLSSDQRLRNGATHGSALPSPESRGEASTTPNDARPSSARGSVPQDLSPVQPYDHQPHVSTEIYHPQRCSAPPTTQILPDSTTIQSDAIRTPSSGSWPKPHEPIAQEHLGGTRSFVPINSSPGLGNAQRNWGPAPPCENTRGQHSLQGPQSSMPNSAPPVQQQPYQPEDPEDTGCLDQPMGQASFIPDQPFEVYQDTDLSAIEIDWNDMTLWGSDVSTSYLLFQASGEELSL